jgi:hypothetical protein
MVKTKEKKKTISKKEVKVKKTIIKKEAAKKPKAIIKADTKVQKINEKKFEKDDLMNLLKEEITKVKDKEHHERKTTEMSLLHTGFSNQSDIDLRNKQTQKTVDNAIKKDEQFTIISRSLNLTPVELQQRYKVYTYYETGPNTESPSITNHPISYFFYNHLFRTLKDYTGAGDTKDIILLTSNKQKFVIINFNSISVQKMVYFINSRDFAKYRDNKDVYLAPTNIDRSEGVFSDILKNNGCVIRII